MKRHTAFMLTGVAIFGYATAKFPETGFAPAWGQDVAARVGPASSGTLGAAPIPDFSGIWSHPYFPGFEPPASGPGPVLNKSRVRGGPYNGVSDFRQFVGDYNNPILNVSRSLCSREI